MKTMKRNADKERIVADFLRSMGVAKPRWYESDISRPLTLTLVAMALSFTALGIDRIGWINGLLGAAGFFGGIGFLVAIYLTYRWEWPRLIRYFRHIFRRDY